MTHPTEQLTAWIDGALSPEEQEQVARHVDLCAACRAERDRLAAAARTLRSLAAAPPAISPSFEQRFYARLAGERSTRRRGLLERLGLRSTGASAWRWLAPALAGVATAAVVLVYTGGRPRTDDALLVSNLDLFENYEEVASLGAIDSPEDLQVVAHLHELRRSR